MATFTSNTYDGRYLQLTITESVNAKTNTSTLTWALQSLGGSVNYYSTAATTVTINGTTVYSKAATSWSSHAFPAAKGSTSGTISVTHGSDGKKSITVGFSTRVYYSAAQEYGGTMTLTNIDRTAPTVSLSTSNVTASGVTVKATASTTCDRWDYSIDGGLTWTNYSTTSGTSASKSITGLTPNTTYSIKVRTRKSSNEVYGASSTSSVKTLGGSVISSVSTFTADAATAKITMSATVYNTSYTHTLVIKNGSTTVLTISSLNLSNGSNTITLTTTQRSTVLAAMSRLKNFTGTFTLTTYSGSSQIGNSSSKTATIQTTSANSAPTFSGFTYEDANTTSVGVTGNNQIFIQSISSLKLTLTAATAKNGASISSYSVVAGSKTTSSTSTTITVGTILDSGTVPVVVTAIDSRGYTTAATVNITVLAYEGINITSYSMRRVNEVEDTTQVEISGEITPVTINGTNKNSLRYLYYRYKKTSDSSYNDYASITSSTEYDDNGFTFSSDEWLSLDADYSYYVQFLVTDRLTSDTVTITVPQGTPLLAFRRKKVGVNTVNPQAAFDVKGKILCTELPLPPTYITKNANINDIITPGEYVCPFNDWVATMENCPVDSAFSLKVMQTVGRSDTGIGLRQIIQTYPDNFRIVVRNMYYSGGFGAWIQIYPEITRFNQIRTISDDTPARWVELGNGTFYFSLTGCLISQPKQWGFVINHVAAADVFQIWHSQPSGDICIRSGNGNGWANNGNWTKIGSN